MDSEPGYDTTRLEALREELIRLNDNARREGFLVPGGDDDSLMPAAPSRRRRGPTNRGKAGARRLLAMLGRIEGDESPPVPGTDFTEAGVVRLLAHLRRRRSQGFRFLRELHQLLLRPVPLGFRTSAGVGVTQLQLVSRRLKVLEAHGWDHVQSIREARRGATPVRLLAAASRRSSKKSAKSQTRKKAPKKPTARKLR